MNSKMKKDLVRCSRCGAPFTDRDDLGDVLKCSCCGNEVIRKVSFEDRISKVTFNKILQDGNISKTMWFLLELFCAHLCYLTFRWAHSPNATGIVAWVAWGCVVWLVLAMVLVLVIAVFLQEKMNADDRKVFEQCDWSIEKFRVLANAPKTKISRRLRKRVENEYQTVKKWMS